MMANTFQVLISLAYVAYNGLISCMLVADEWCGFAKDRKTLRVSAPVGIQRSSYALSMPFSYGIPMTIISSVTHWLVSQSTFVVRIKKFNYNGEQGGGWTTSGYSLMPSLIGKKSFYRHWIFPPYKILKSCQLLFPAFDISCYSRQSAQIPTWIRDAACVHLQRGHQCCMPSSGGRQRGPFVTGAMGRCRERWSEHAVLFLHHFSRRRRALHGIFLFGDLFFQRRRNTDWLTC